MRRRTPLYVALAAEEPLGRADPQTLQLFVNGRQQILENRFNVMVRRAGDLGRQMPDSIIKATGRHTKRGRDGRARLQNNA